MVFAIEETFSLTVFIVSKVFVLKVRVSVDEITVFVVEFVKLFFNNFLESQLLVLAQVFLCIFLVRSYLKYSVFAQKSFHPRSVILNIKFV